MQIIPQTNGNGCKIAKKKDGTIQTSMRAGRGRGGLIYCNSSILLMQYSHGYCELNSFMFGMIRQSDIFEDEAKKSN
jgi:hypothetical protein